MLQEQAKQLELEEAEVIDMLDVMEAFGNAMSMPGIPASTPVPTASPSLATEEPTDSFGGTDNSTDFPSEEPSPSPTEMPSIEATSMSPTLSSAPSLSPSGSPTISMAPSNSPIVDGCGIPAEQRRLEILEIIREATNSTLIEDLDTPQGMATDWIINEDLRRLCPDSRKIIQRWTLAVMYFSTGGDDWLQCFAGDPSCGNASPFFNRDAFLSPSIECEWAGISCNSEACVTEVEFEENRLVGTIPTELGLLSDLVSTTSEVATCR